jgi:precorrin-2 dehydrogenase/sirohydrochlorin ferrochelatase
VGLYAVFLEVSGRTCVVVGGDEEAARKTAGLLSAGASVRVVAPSLCPALAERAVSGEILHVERTYAEADLDGAALAIVTDPDPTVRERVSKDAQCRGVLVNVLDEPERSTFVAPAILDRGELRIAVATSGAAPAFAARVRDRIGEVVGPEYAEAVSWLRQAREKLRQRGGPAAERRRILKELAASGLPELLRKGERAEAEELLARALEES